MDMTIQEYLDFEQHLLEQAEGEGFTYYETKDETSNWDDAQG